MPVLAFYQHIIHNKFRKAEVGLLINLFSAVTVMEEATVSSHGAPSPVCTSHCWLDSAVRTHEPHHRSSHVLMQVRELGKKG